MIVCWRLKREIRRAHGEPASATVKEISHYKRSAASFAQMDAALNNQSEKRGDEDEKTGDKKDERGGGDGGGCFVTAGDRGEEEREGLKGPKKMDFCRL